MIPVTALSSFEYCPRKLYLERILLLATENKDAMVRGSLHHNCLEAFTNIEPQLVTKITSTLSYADVVDLFVAKAKTITAAQYAAFADTVDKTQLDKAKLRNDLLVVMHGEARARARDIVSFSEQHGGVHGQQLWDLLDPKRQSERWITLKDLGVRGIIDCILQFRDGALIPIEYKTGKAPSRGVWPGHKLQVGAYAVLMEREFGVRIDYGVIRYLDHSREEKVYVNPALRDEVLQLIRQVQDLLTSPTLPARISNERKCVVCSYKEQCYDDAFMQNRLALALSAKKEGRKLEKFFV